MWRTHQIVFAELKLEHLLPIIFKKLRNVFETGQHPKEAVFLAVYMSGQTTALSNAPATRQAEQRGDTSLNRSQNVTATAPGTCPEAARS